MGCGNATVGVQHRGRGSGGWGTTPLSEMGVQSEHILASLEALLGDGCSPSGLQSIGENEIESGCQ